MNRSTNKILAGLLALTIAWFPLAGFSAGCLDVFPGSVDSNTVISQLLATTSACADEHPQDYLDSTPDCPDCDTHQHDCNGDHAQCSSGITLFLQTQESIVDFTHATWHTTYNPALPSTYPAPALRPPISI